MRRPLCALAIALICCSAIIHAGAPEEGKPVVVCTTTVLASIVKDLAGDLVVVEVIASPAVCPAHYDVRPSDVDAFRRASLILMHGFEPWVTELAEASKTRAPIVRIRGPWNTPEALKARYADVAKALEEYLGLKLDDRLAKCLEAIDKTDAWLKDFARENGFEGTPVVCMLWQRAFVEYLGFKIVAVYRPPEYVSAKEYKSIVENATREGALLVIDNLQSGVELGIKIAKEVGAVEVALTNFPGVAPGLNNMTQVMKYNAIKLASALEQARASGELRRLQGELRMWRTLAVVSLILAAAFAASTAYLARRR